MVNRIGLLVADSVPLLIEIVSQERDISYSINQWPFDRDKISLLYGRTTSKSKRNWRIVDYQIDCVQTPKK